MTLSVNNFDTVPTFKQDKINSVTLHTSGGGDYYPIT